MVTFLKQNIPQKNGNYLVKMPGMRETTLLCEIDKVVTVIIAPPCIITLQLVLSLHKKLSFCHASHCVCPSFPAIFNNAINQLSQNIQSASIVALNKHFCTETANKNSLDSGLIMPWRLTGRRLQFPAQTDRHFPGTPMSGSSWSSSQEQHGQGFAPKGDLLHWVRRKNISGVYTIPTPPKNVWPLVSKILQQILHTMRQFAALPIAIFGPRRCLSVRIGTFWTTKLRNSEWLRNYNA